MKSINLRGVSETLSEREMKRVVGGNGCPPGCYFSGAGCVCDDGNVESGTITGYRCSQGVCYVDIVYDDDPYNTWCEQVVPMIICTQMGGLSC